MKKKILIYLLCLALTIPLAACGGGASGDNNGPKNSGAENHVAQNPGEGGSGTGDMYYVGQGRVVPDLDPLNSSWQLTAHGVSEYVFQLDKEGNLYSRFIDTLEKTGDLTWKATMKKDVKFSDGTPVDAKALADAMNYIQENNELARATAGRITFTPEGEDLAIATERPTNVMKSIFAEWTNVVFKKDGDDYIYTGPFKVDSLTPNNEIVMSPNEYYPQGDKRPKVTVKAFKDEAAMKTAFSSGELDLIFPITPDLKDQLDSEGATTKTIDAGYQYFARVNLQKAPMKDLKFCQAIDLGLNREDYVKALKGGHVPTGLFAHYYPFNGDIKLVYDPEKAKGILEELGWKEGSDGIREKDGQKLTLDIATLAFRKDLVILGQVITSQLKELGIDAKVEALDSAEDVDGNSKYAILLYSQHSAPTGEPSYFLNQFFRTGEGKNRFGYSNPAVDALLDELGATDDMALRNEKAKEVQNKLQEDLVNFLIIDPQWHGGFSERLKDYELYCGDYYVVNDQFGL